MDDRKSSTKSKGGWIIADEEGRENLSGFNPDFGKINKKPQSWNIRSTMSIYATQWILYFQQNGTQIINSILMQQQWSFHKAEIHITEKDQKYYSSISKIKDLDAVLEIQACIPTTVTVTRVK